MQRPAEDKMIRPREDKRLEAERCPKCGRILCRGHLEPGSVVEIKCACNQVTTIKVLH